MVLVHRLVLAAPCGASPIGRVACLRRAPCMTGAWAPAAWPSPSIPAWASGNATRVSSPWTTSPARSPPRPGGLLRPFRAARLPACGWRRTGTARRACCCSSCPEKTRGGPGCLGPGRAPGRDPHRRGTAGAAGPGGAAPAVPRGGSAPVRGRAGELPLQLLPGAHREHAAGARLRGGAEASWRRRGRWSVTCEFCNQRYDFDRVDAEHLFAAADPLPGCRPPAIDRPSAGQGG